MQRWKHLLLPLLLVGSIAPVTAGPNFVGQSGTIVTPDDRLLLPREFSLSYHFLDKKAFTGGDDAHIVSANYGFTSRLEAGVSYLDRGRTDLLVNGKFHVLTEERKRPSLTVGVVDLFDALDNDPGFYFLLGKNLTWTSGDVRQETEGRALHAYIGAGTGPYDGLLAGFNFVATPRLSLLAEYAPEGPITGRDNSVNVGARFAISPRVRVSAALIDFDNVGFGISFTSGLRGGPR